MILHPLTEVEKIVPAGVPGIYGLVNMRIGRIYIGSSVDLRTRLKWRTGDLRRGGACATQDMRDDLRRFGEQAFEFTIIEAPVPEPALQEREQHWIDRHRQDSPAGVYNTKSALSGRASWRKYYAARRGDKT